MTDYLKFGKGKQARWMPYSQYLKWQEFRAKLWASFTPEQRMNHELMLWLIKMTDIKKKDKKEHLSPIQYIP